MIEWKRVPWTLWAYSVTMLAGVVFLEAKVHGPILARVLLVPLMLGWIYLLFRGVRWVWIGTVGINVLGFVPGLIEGSLTWWNSSLSLVQLVLLLLPVTWRHFPKHNIQPGLKRAPTR